MKYIALLRGINVGGHNIIPMVKLKTMFESAGFKNVTTYIQSGNVLFDSAIKNADTVRTKIEHHLRDSLGYEVPTLIRTIADMKKVVATNPFAQQHSDGKTKLYIVFLENKPTTSQQQAVLETQVKGMSFNFGNRELYCLVDAKFSGNNSPFSNTRIEKLLTQRSTTRNWATVNTLLEMGEI